MGSELQAQHTADLPMNDEMTTRMMNPRNEFLTLLLLTPQPRQMKRTKFLLFKLELLKKFAWGSKEKLLNNKLSKELSPDRFRREKYLFKQRGKAMQRLFFRVQSPVHWLFRICSAQQ